MITGILMNIVQFLGSWWYILFIHYLVIVAKCFAHILQVSKVLCQEAASPSCLVIFRCGACIRPLGRHIRPRRSQCAGACSPQNCPIPWKSLI